MKRILTAIIGLVLLAGTAAPTFAQNARRRDGRRVEQTGRYSDTRRDDYRRYDRRDQDESFWDEHRDKVTVAAGAGAGAVVGGVAGGKKGAIIGALVGAGGSALYTYVLRDRDDDDEREYRRRR